MASNSMALILAISSLSVFISSVIIGLPLLGVTVRLWADYTGPGELRLAPEGDEDPRNVNPAISFVGMFRRVIRIEGWAGLYKGLMPTSLSTLMTIVFMVLFLSFAPKLLSTGIVFQYRATQMVVMTILQILIFLPIRILTYRSIVTPYKLSSFHPIVALQTLLTPVERHRPWILLLTPGLVAVDILLLTYDLLFVPTLKALLVPDLHWINPNAHYLEHVNPVKFSIYVVVILLSITVRCPLEVLRVRLTIQCNHASIGADSVDSTVEGGRNTTSQHHAVMYSGIDEDVIRLRDTEPYHGLVHGIKTIVHEEGWQTLYRVWWIPLIVVLNLAFNQ